MPAFVFLVHCWYLRSAASFSARMRKGYLQGPQALTEKCFFFFLGRFITELKPVKARQHKMGQCSLTDTVCPPNVFSNSVEMFICHICQHLALALGAFFFVPESRDVPVPAFAVMRGI